MKTKTVVSTALLAFFAASACAETRVGIIGCDTSHAIEFTKIMNVKKDPRAAGFRMAAAYQWGSRDIVSSTNRYPKYLAQLRDMGVAIVPSVEALLAQVDCVCLETNDGREHLWQAEKVFKAGKRVFIDKPIAHNLRDALAIYELGKKYNAAYFSSSALRFTAAVSEIAAGRHGKMRSAFYFAPAPAEPQGTHGRYTWYGIHGFEPIVAMMGTGAASVRAIAADKTDIIVMTWKDGRVATLRATANVWKYGGYAFPEKGEPLVLGGYEGYETLLENIVTFFKTGVTPVPHEQTLEIFALMEAAEMSLARDGAAVTLDEALKKCAR